MLYEVITVHLITDADIARRSSFAVKIGAVTDPAQPLLEAGPPDALAGPAAGGTQS